MSADKPKNKIIIEQLLTKDAFLRHCKSDYLSGLKLDINKDFLVAAEKDGFLRPLKTKDKIKYYSPHQIFIIAALYKNKVHDGVLWADSEVGSVDWYKKQGFRMVCWGWNGHAFNITHAKKGGRSNVSGLLDHLDVCKKFHKFLIFLHSHPQKDDYEQRRHRYFNPAPKLFFDFNSLKKDGKKALKEFGLSLKTLNLMRKEVANFATDIDPLEYWFYYIELHPRWRKDLFKGVALLAQEMYMIYDILTEVETTITGEIAPSLLEFLHGDNRFVSFLMPKREYAEGVDVKALWATINQFDNWSKLAKNKAYVNNETINKLKLYKKELSDYETRYGAKSYLSGSIRTIECEEDLTLGDLDGKTRSTVESFMKQYSNIRKDKNGKEHYLTRDEVMDLLIKKEITQEEAESLDIEIERKERIAMAIEWRLDELKRELYSILDDVGSVFQNETTKAWDKAQNFSQWLWMNKREEYDSLSKEGRQEFFRKEQSKATKAAEKCGNRRDEFYSLVQSYSLVFCKRCRERPVQLHYGNNDRQATNIPICDTCFTQIKSGVLSFDDEKWKSITEGHIVCSCGKLLFKFAHGNVLSSLTQGGVSAKIELIYGRSCITVRCPKCKTSTERYIDWGWA